jgi:hypothetical protein
LTYFAAFWNYKGGVAVLQALKLITGVEEVKRNFAAAEVFLVAVIDFA